MKSKAVKYSARAIGRVKVIEDFLPSPEAMAARGDNVKAKLGFSRSSAKYLKRAAKTRRVPRRMG